MINPYHRLQLFQNCFRDKPHPVITTPPIIMATPQTTPTLIELNLWNHFYCTVCSCFLDVNSLILSHGSILLDGQKKLVLIELMQVIYSTSWLRQPSIVARTTLFLLLHRKEKGRPLQTKTIQYKSRRIFRDQGQSLILGDCP